MKRVFCKAAAVILIILSILLLLEGEIQISTIKESDFSNHVSSLSGSAQLCYMEYSENQDAVVCLYRDSDSTDTYYVLEFSKNALWNRYALGDQHQCTDPPSAINTVVSSPFYHYAYHVDFEDMTISIFEGTPRYNILNLLPTFVLGVLLIYPSFKKGERK